MWYNNWTDNEKSLSHTVPVESNVSYSKCVFKLDVVWQITIQSIYERYTRVSKVTVIENTTLTGTVWDRQ
jgi:hypothetical protein